MRVVVEVWWSSLVAADSRLLGDLDPVERMRLKTMDRQADRGRSLVGFALLRVAVGEHLGIAPHDVLIDRTCADCGEPHGRPRVAGPRSTAPSVSVSHSGLLVVIALSADTVVGVDVQRVADLDDPAGAAPPDVEGWVRREAIRKLGVDGRPDLHALAPPLDGYAAALATLTPPDADVEVLVRHWAADSGA